MCASQAEIGLMHPLSATVSIVICFMFACEPKFVIHGVCVCVCVCVC